ncbi:MAG: ATP-binding protein [Burkholderiales bacterium]|nr:GAF domain-containing protein [Sulfuricellaceae bacterium]
MKPSNPSASSGQNTLQGSYKIPALRVLSEITSSLSSENNLEELLERFLSTLIKLSGADAGAVRVLTADGTRLRLVGALGLPPNVVESERYIKVECGVCGEALRRHGVQYSADTSACSERAALDYFGKHCRHVVAVPLRYKGKLLGVYNLFMAHDQPVPDEVALLFHSISEHLGMALENARLTRENMRITLTNERQMLANEVHDSLAQTLAYMKMRLTLLRDAVGQSNPQKSAKYLDDVSQALDSAYSGLRGLITNFRIRMDPRGLLHALQEIVDTFHDRTEITLDFNNYTPDLNLTPDEEVQVFHIVQEALANIFKHSQARHARLTMVLEDGEYVISIEDDGIGIPRHTDEASGKMHFGLNIMRERAHRLGGDIAIHSREDGGTRVALSFPAKWREPRA